MRKIFFIETPSSAVQHGVGTYAANLIKSMMVYEDCKVYYVQIKFGSSVAFSEVKEKEGFYKILIQFEDPVIKKKQETAIHPLQARVIFCLLSKYFTIEGYNILHLNSLLQRTIGDVAKEYEYKIVLTLHVSLWRVFFNNNKQSFIEKWNSHDLADQKSVGMLSMREEERMCQAADRIICLTEESKDFICQYYAIDEHKTTIIPNGLLMSNATGKNEMEDIRRSLGFATADFIFIYVGRLIEQKGIGVLLEAFKKIAKRSGSIKLLVVGSGNTDMFLPRIFECCGQITFTGYQPAENLAQLYKIANCGVMPSTTEQSSFVILEMLSRKLPVILSDIDAFKKFENEKHVTSVKTDDRGYVYIDLLYKAMKHVFEDATYRNRIAGNGHQLFLEQYQASTMAEKTFDVYKKVTGPAAVIHS